jgi:hypothetical protein
MLMLMLMLMLVVLTADGGGGGGGGAAAACDRIWSSGCGRLQSRSSTGWGLRATAFS